VTPPRATAIAAACVLTLALCTAARAANPPVVYVHGLGEDACATSNLGAVLDTVRERLPQGDLPRPPGSSCPSAGTPGANPLRFHYVRDRADGGDQDRADGGSSQGGVGANARALHEYIGTLVDRGNRKVMLVGFSMGGLVIRSYLAKFGHEAGEHVAAAAFVESAHAGSYFATVAAAVASDDATRECKAQVFTLPAGPLNSALCLALLKLARDEFNLNQPGAIALRDLQPRSEAVRAVASSSIPREPRYLNVAGDLVVRVPAGKIGEWAFGKPYDDYELGDGIIPKGNSDPRETPVLGGGLFDPRRLGSGYDARQVLVPEICEVAPVQREKLVDTLASVVGRAAKDPRAKAALYVGRKLLGAADAVGHGFDCMRHAPPAHWNINEHAAEAQPGKVKNVPAIVGDFLVDTCKAQHLGWCGPEPLVGPGGECGTYTTGEIPSYGPPGGDRRSRTAVLRVEAGSLRCSEARAELDRYVHAHNPCQNAGNTCPLDHDGWTCLTPSAGSYPVIYRCDQSSSGAELAAYEAKALAVQPAEVDCGNGADDTPGPFQVRANVACETALAVARAAVAKGEECTDSCLVEGFTCTTRNTGYESAATECTWRERRVRFETGS
jgi:pimeloyl-ACP methyl ester carboxylesterase